MNISLGPTAKDLHFRSVSWDVMGSVGSGGRSVMVAVLDLLVKVTGCQFVIALSTETCFKVKIKVSMLSKIIKKLLL